jgi:hypothetical protein
MLPEDGQTLEKPNLAALAGDILQDTQKLVEQQIALAKLQAFEDWSSFKPFIWWVALSVVSLFSAGLLFAFTVVFILNEGAQLPLWLSFGITVLIFLSIGGMSVFVARRKSKVMSFLHD